MKTKFLVVLVLVGMFFATACKKGPSEETMKSVAEFEATWSEIGQQATAWNDQLKVSVDECTKMCMKNDSLSSMPMEGMSDEMKGKCMEAAAACKSDKTTFETMCKEWEAFKTGWEGSSIAFSEFKGKIIKGKINDEETKKMLEEFKTKMNVAKAQVEGWHTAYTATQEDCLKNMQCCESTAKMAMDEIAGIKGKKKKK